MTPHGSASTCRVLVDQATEVLPFAQMLHQIASMLRGPAFGQAWPAIENSLGLDRLPEPARKPCDHWRPR